jgi:membrane-associated phospholipid phosphatase
MVSPLTIALTYSGYLALLAPVWPWVARRRLARAPRDATRAGQAGWPWLRVALGEAGAAACALLMVLAERPRTPWVLAEALLPAAALLVGYWASGLFYVAPMPRVERALHALDRRLRVPEIARRAPPAVADVLEAAYVAVYPLTLVGLVLYLILSPAADPDRFWTLVLATDFACFGCLPWIQTRTPRAFEPGDPWRSRLRPLNLLIVHRASIQVNTFPSGHTAEALAIALLMLEAGPWAFAALVAVAAAISAGAVLGRYHYLADAVAGYVVALGVWIVVTPR